MIERHLNGSFFAAKAKIYANRYKELRGVTLEVEIRFKKNELAVGVSWVDFLNRTLAPSVAIVESRSKASRDLIVGAEVPDVGEPPVATAWTASVPESSGLERASA